MEKIEFIENLKWRSLHEWASELFGIERYKKKKTKLIFCCHNSSRKNFSILQGKKVQRGNFYLSNG